jgi:putative membrane protein
MLVTAALNRSLQRGFAREWAESLQIKHRSPLGEIEILRLWRMRGRGGRQSGDTQDGSDDLEI